MAGGPIAAKRRNVSQYAITLPCMWRYYPPVPPLEQSRLGRFGAPSGYPPTQALAMRAETASSKLADIPAEIFQFVAYNSTSHESTPQPRIASQFLGRQHKGPSTLSPLRRSNCRRGCCTMQPHPVAKTQRLATRRCQKREASWGETRPRKLKPCFASQDVSMPSIGTCDLVSEIARHASFFAS